ncbi:hypothetical protein ACFQJ8_27025 [Halocatena marina]|uniref:hypothetical protein n=1 Tax=Halocatena marina TaxID=2934937 RepID=UPI003614FC1D
MSKHDSISDTDASSSHTNHDSEPDQPSQNGQAQDGFDLSQLSQLSNFSRFTNGGTNTQSTGVDLSRLGNGIDLSSLGDSLLGSDRTVVDLAPITTAYRNSFAVERTDEAVIGAVKIEPASMSMVDDIEPHILGFASVLAASTIHKGMLIDVPRSVDYSNRWERYRAHKERLAERDEWTAQLQADLCEERETIASLYEQTTTQRDHYIIVEVDKREAATTLSNDDGGLANLPVIGDFIAEGNAERLRDKNRLQAVMVELLERRMSGLAKTLSDLDGISARCLPSSEFVQVISNYYRTDDVYRIKDFPSLVRQSPIADGDGDPEHEVSHYADRHGVSSLADENQREHQLKTLVTPETVTPEQNDGITIDGERRAATIAVTGWPEVPGLAFLEPVYQYSGPGIDVSVATHFQRKSLTEAKREAKNQENSLEDKLDGALGSVFEEAIERKLTEAHEFTEAIEWSDYGVFEAGIYITVTAPAPDPNARDKATEPLDDAIEDLTLILREECGFDVKRITHNHEAGWQTTAPIAQNKLGENVTLLGDGLARQFPYRYQNLAEPGGVKLGMHEYLREPTVVNILNPDFRANGYNGGIYGMTGSGKTTTIQEMVDQLKLLADANDEDLTIVLSTPLEDFKSICDTYDGEHIVAGGSNVSINVLDIKYVPPEKLDVIGAATPGRTCSIERIASSARFTTASV